MTKLNAELMYNTRELFANAKDRLDIKDVARSYGLDIDRSGKAVCPFHNDTHPSMSFKGQMFKCFSCGAGGDVFTLAGQLLGISKPLDVLKRLNADFALGLPLEKQRLNKADIERSKKAQQERKHKQELQQAFDKWVKHALYVCTSYAKLLRLWRVEYAPIHEKQEPHPLFVESLQNLTRIEYLCECLTFGNKSEQQAFYKACRNEVKAIEQRIDEYSRAKAC